MKTYPLFKAHIDIKSALTNIEMVFDSGFINEGLEVTTLSKLLSGYLCSDKLVLVNSCTSALTLALHLAKRNHISPAVVPGRDKVISTSMTCVATNTPIVTSGHEIIWADVDPLSGMVTEETVRDAIFFSGEKEKIFAVIVVAWAGTPPELDKIYALCQQHGIKLILDAAHAFDAYYDNLPIHEFADYTCYSFQAIKHFTTGDGGALICKSKKDYELAKSLKWFGLDRDKAKDTNGDWKGQQWDVDIVDAGFKFNMNNISAAIGLSQFESIKENLNRHKNNAKLFEILLSGQDLVQPAKKSIKADSSHWVYTVLLDKSIDKELVIKLLNDENIKAGLVHVPNHLYTAFKEFKKDLPGVDEFFMRQFSLPCGWWIDFPDVHHIAKRLLEIVHDCKKH